MEIVKDNQEKPVVKAKPDHERFFIIRGDYLAAAIQTYVNSTGQYGEIHRTIKVLQNLEEYFPKPEVAEKTPEK